MDRDREPRMVYRLVGVQSKACCMSSAHVRVAVAPAWPDPVKVGSSCTFPSMSESAACGCDVTARRRARGTPAGYGRNVLTNSFTRWLS